MQVGREFLLQGENTTFGRKEKAPQQECCWGLCKLRALSIVPIVVGGRGLLDLFPCALVSDLRRLVLGFQRFVRAVVQDLPDGLSGGVEPNLRQLSMHFQQVFVFFLQHGIAADRFADRERFCSGSFLVDKPDQVVLCKVLLHTVFFVKHLTGIF